MKGDIKSRKDGEASYRRKERALDHGALKKNLSKLENFCVTILILKMEEKKQHFWHITLYYFNKDKTTAEIHKNDLCSVWRRSCD